jgi:hypothetical protein
MADLKALNARFIHNFVTNDVKSHDAMMHPDFIYIRPGVRQNRADYLKQWATQFDPEVIVYWDVRDGSSSSSIMSPSFARPTSARYAGTAGHDQHVGLRHLPVPEGNGVHQADPDPATRSYPGDDTIVSVYIKGKRQ